MLALRSMVPWLAGGASRATERSAPAMTRVLVLTNDPTTESYLSAHTERFDEELLFLESPDEALRMLRRAEADALILDEALDARNALAVCRELHDDKRTAEVPILYLAENGSVATMERAFSAGAHAVEPKPARAQAIRKRLKSMFKPEAAGLAPDFRPPQELVDAYARVTERARRLGDVAEVFAGILPHDKHRHIAEVKRGPQWEPMLVEKDIVPYGIVYGGTHVCYAPRQLLRVPPPELMSGRKVVVKRAGPPCTAAVDSDRFLIGDSVYGIVPASGLECDYLAAVLNSRLIDFYFRRIRPPRPEEGMASMLRQIDLEDLPVLLPKKSAQAAIVDLARQAADLADPGPSLRVDQRRVLNALNRGIFEIYGFGKREVKRLADLNF